MPHGQAPTGSPVAEGERPAPERRFEPVGTLTAIDRGLSGGRRLFYGGESSVRRSLAVRGLVVLTLLGAVILLFWFEREGLRDAHDGQISFIDAVYFAFVTVTTVGYGDIAPVAPSTRLLDAILVTPIRLFIWLIFLGTAYQLVIQRVVEDIRMRVRQSRLRDHIVLCGFGHGGQAAARELRHRGHAADRIVAIDVSEAAMASAAEAGLVGLLGDATREAILLEACVPAARTVIVTVGRDDTAALVILTVRNLAPGVRVVASAREEENEKLLRQSGASIIVTPARIGGALLASSVESSEIGEYVEDLVTIEGPIALKRRAAAAADVGRRPGEVSDGFVLRIRRGGRVIGFWEPEAVIEAGDVLILASPTGGPAAHP